ncbi:MAG: hypothetical protein ACSHWY_00510 [Octadecabacter sp.]
MGPALPQHQIEAQRVKYYDDPLFKKIEMEQHPETRERDGDVPTAREQTLDMREAFVEELLGMQHLLSDA